MATPVGAGSRLDPVRRNKRPDALPARRQHLSGSVADRAEGMPDRGSHLPCFRWSTFLKRRLKPAGVQCALRSGQQRGANDAG